MTSQAYVEVLWMGWTLRVGQDLRTLWRTLEPRPLTRSPRLRRQHVLLTVAVEFTHEIPYCPPNAMDVADPHAHFIYVWYRQYQLETYETEWKSFKYCQTYVVQLEKSISQRCDTKCCHTNVVADPTIIECDEHVILWGKMFDCNRVIIGLDLGVGDLFWNFIFSMIRTWKWFNSKQNPKYSFKKIFIQLSKGNSI